MVNQKRYRKTSRKIILIWIVVTVIALLMCGEKSYAITSYQLSGSNYTLLTDNRNVYAVRYNDIQVTAEIIKEKECCSITFKAMGTVKNITVNNGNIYALSLDGGKMVLNQYSVRNDSVYYYPLNTVNIWSDYRFSVTENRICFMTNETANTFVCTDIYGEKIYSFSVAEEVIDYTLNNEDNFLYIFGRNNIYRTDIRQSKTPECILSTVDMRTGITVDENTVFDYSGNIIDISEKMVISTGIQGQRNGCVIDGHYCKYTNGGIEVFENNGVHYTVCSMNYGTEVQLCGKNNTAYLLSAHGKLAVIENNSFSFSDYGQTPVDTDSHSTSLSDNTQSSSYHTVSDNSNVSDNALSSVVEDEEEFCIYTYKVDTAKNIIWDIPKDTTIAMLKKNISKGHYTLEFRNKNNTPKTSGKVGTGYTMTVKDGNTTVAVYRLAVKGELTGEGNINFNDIKVLCYYVMQCGDLDEWQYVSADLTYDGIIDSRDIRLLAKIIPL